MFYCALKNAKKFEAEFHATRGELVGDWMPRVCNEIWFIKTRMPSVQTKRWRKAVSIDFLRSLQVVVQIFHEASRYILATKFIWKPIKSSSDKHEL